MSIFAHATVLGLLVIDLLFGGQVIDHFGGRFAVAGFEFALILGYVLFVLQLLPWRRDGEP
jgi:hypothetical protein